MEWLTVLRMNKDFMEFMRFHYPDDAGLRAGVQDDRRPRPGPDRGGGARL